jgi:hypothetical protein
MALANAFQPRGCTWSMMEVVAVVLAMRVVEDRKEPNDAWIRAHRIGDE